MRLITLTLLLGTLAGLASADRLNLNNGNVIQGTYLGGTARQIRFEVNGNVQTYDVGQVRSLSFVEDSPQFSAQPVPQSFPQPAPQPAYSDRNYSAPANTNPQYAANGHSGITIPADTQITVRMIDAVNSQTARIGQTFRASLDEPVVVADRQIIPRGADVIAKLVDDQKAGKLQGKTVLTVALVSISVNGQMADVTTTDVRTASASRGNKSAGLIGGGAALGAIVGAIAGGGKGAAIGAASGGALGGATTILMSGQEVKIPSETRLTFRLQYPVQL